MALVVEITTRLRGFFPPLNYCSCNDMVPRKFHGYAVLPPATREQEHLPRLLGTDLLDWHRHQHLRQKTVTTESKAMKERDEKISLSLSYMLLIERGKNFEEKLFLQS